MTFQWQMLILHLVRRERRWRIRAARVHLLAAVLVVLLLMGSMPPEPSTINVRWAGEIDGGWIVLWTWGKVRVESLHATEREAAVLEAVLRRVEMEAAWVRAR